MVFISRLLTTLINGFLQDIFPGTKRFFEPIRGGRATPIFELRGKTFI